MAEPLR
ncbi:uncharacterized protein FFNC_13868 [Fusarium fujikuroi]|nr:uncharacterized protein FFNC_13868 [Fusarium fujikuroi]